MSENQMLVQVYAYTLLNNILVLLDGYIANTEKISPSSNLKKYFETFKKMKYIYKSKISEDDKIEYLEFYHQMIENKENYKGCIEAIKQYQLLTRNLKLNDENKFEKQFCSNITEQKLETLQKEYIENYYETQKNKNKRIYKTENAGVNWSEQDIKRFDDGLRLFGHCQLANNKIAKYMGSHIEVSHVKLLRGKISREQRIKKKQEKEIKISEMKKKKNLNWKFMTDLNEH